MKAIGLGLLGATVASCAGSPKTHQAARTAESSPQAHARCAAEVPGTNVSLQRVGNTLEVAFRTRIPQQVDDLRAHAFQQGQTIRGRASGGGLTTPVEPLPPVVVQTRPLPDGIVLAYQPRDADDFEVVHTMLRNDVDRQNRGQCSVVRPGSTGMGDTPPAAVTAWEYDPVPEAPDREWKPTITAVELSEPLARACRIPPDRRREVFDTADARVDGYPVLTTLVRCLDRSGTNRKLRVLGRAEPSEPGEFEQIAGKSRAALVGSFLEKQGIAVEVVDHAGHQDAGPVDNQGWSWERRVDIE